VWCDAVVAVCCWDRIGRVLYHTTRSFDSTRGDILCSPSCPEEISRIYQDFVQGAFGDAETYEAVSPVSGSYSKTVWPGGKLVVLGYSEEDELVEVGQRDAMVERLKHEGWTEEGKGDGERIIKVQDLKGGHDEIWEKGSQIAQLVSQVMETLRDR
jgi:kynurenine formamidase